MIDFFCSHRTDSLRKLLFALLLLVCPVSFTVFPARLYSEEPELKIGAVLPLSGPAAELGTIIKNGLLMARDDLNRTGGIRSRKVRLLIEDTVSQQKNAVSAFNKLAGPEKVKFIFTIVSSHAMALKPLAERYQVLLFADASHPGLTRNTSYILRHSNIASHDAHLMAETLGRTSFQEIGVIYQQDDWGVIYKDTLTKNLTRKGIKVNTEPFVIGDSNFNAQLLKIRGSDAIVVAALGPTAGQILRDLRRLGFSGTLYSSVGFVLSPEAEKIAGAAAKGLFYQTYNHNNDFKKAYRQTYKTDPPLLGQIAYTDLELLAKAISETASTDPLIVANYIKTLGSFKGRFESVQIKANGDIPVDTYIAYWNPAPARVPAQ
jgi:branched-chain amino acid transport system substrate-binding protein